MNISSITWGRLNWVYVEKPTRAEVEYLAQHFPQFHPLNLDDVLSQIQRPKIDEYEDHLFVVLHFPVFDKQNRVSTPSEVDIFIGENYIVSVHCAGNLRPLAQFFNECQNSEEIRRSYLGHSSSYLLYHILDRLVDYCFPMLGKVNQNIEKMEDLILKRPSPETVLELSVIRRDLISFRRLIHPQIAVAEALEKEEYPFFKEEQEVYFGDIADHIRKIWDGLEDSKEVVEGLLDTCNWLTSHRIQEIMRILTIFMAIVMPIEVIASIEGSNLLPGSWLHNPTVFLFSFLVQVLILVTMILFFRRRHWI